jgi:hypothetical protein
MFLAQAIYVLGPLQVAVFGQGGSEIGCGDMVWESRGGAERLPKLHHGRWRAKSFPRFIRENKRCETFRKLNKSRIKVLAQNVVQEGVRE